MSKLSVQGVFRVVQAIEAVILSVSIMLIALLTIVNVFMRSVMGSSVAATEELSQFLIILVTFVGLSYAASQGRHIRMTALYDQFKARHRKLLMIFIAASTSLLMFLLAFYAVHYVLVLRELGSISPVLRVPLWIVYCAAPMGLVMTGIQYLFTVIKNVRAKGVYLSYEHKDEYDEELVEGGY